MEIKFIFLLKKYKLFIGVFTMMAFLISIIWVYSMADFYRAETILYSSSAETLEFFYEILKGNELSRKIATDYDLSEHEVKKAQKIVYDYSVNTLKIRVQWKDSNLAAELANAFSREVSANATSSGIKIIESAVASDNPAGPARIPIVATVVFIGLMGSIFLVGVREYS